MQLSQSARKVKEILISLGYHFTIIESASHTRTAAQAAEFVGCEVGQIVKSLIFKGQKSNKPILVLTSGANRVDENCISRYAGESIVRADPEFVREVTGYAIGGVPPVGHTMSMETYVDEDLLQYVTIWAAAGSPNSVFELTPDALQEMTHGRVVRVK